MENMKRLYLKIRFLDIKNVILPPFFVGKWAKVISCSIDKLNDNYIQINISG